MEYLAEGFGVVEQQAAKFATSEKSVLDQAAKVTGGQRPTCVEELCFLRAYEVRRVAGSFKTFDLAAALAEGAATCVFGAAGIPANIALSTFLYYRAVQSVALCYGYDTHNDPEALALAGQVFTGAFGAEDSVPEIGKFMTYGQLSVVKDTVNKGWTAMAERGGIPLLVTQIRALANKAAAKALQNAGAKELERTMFTDLLEQLGKKLTQKFVGRAVPVVGGVVGGLYDTATMNRVIDYANAFYLRLFIAQKEQRIEFYLQAHPIDAKPAEWIASEAS